MSRLRDVVNGMGDTVDKVANTIRAAGVKGIPDNGYSCPVARFLQLQGFTQVTVALLINARDTDYSMYHIQYSESVRAFVASFDAKGFTDLIEEKVAQ